MSPMQRTLAELKKRGFTAHIVEKWNSFIKIRQDFGGFADVLAYKKDYPGVLAINCCLDNGEVNAHVVKYEVMENVRTWLTSGNRLEVWGWGIRGERGKRKLWTLREVPVKIKIEP